MLPVLAQAVALAAVGILSPGSITIVILMLMSDGGLRNGLAYMVGYIGSYSLIGLGVLSLGLRASGSAPPGLASASSVILLGLGLLLLALTVRNWRRPSVEEGEPSRLVSLIDSITPIRSLALAATVAVANFKNLAIFLSALSVLLLSTLPLATQLAILVPLVLVFCTSVIAPVVIYIVFPGQAHDYLARIKGAIDRFRRPLGLIVPLFLGLLFMYRGLVGIL